MNLITAEQKAVNFSNKVTAHMITKMADDALQNWQAKKLELENLQAAIASGQNVWQAPSNIISEMSFFSGQINAFKAVLSELENA